MASPRQTKTLLAWGMSAALVLAGGSAFYLVRGALASDLDGLLGGAEPEPSPPVEAPVAVVPPPPPPPPEKPPLTYAEVEEMLAPLPEETLALIGEGQEELPEYEGLDSTEPQVAQRILFRWQAWGTTWRNRTGALKKRLPDTVDCERYVEMAPTCALLVRVMSHLDRVPEAATLEEAGEILEEARLELDTFLHPTEEEEAGEEEGEEGAELASPPPS